jgi:hypothetical protein
MDQLFWRDEARRIMQEQNKLLQNIAEQQTNLLLEISSKLDTLIQLLTPRK